MAQVLASLTALVEDLCSVLSTRISISGDSQVPIPPALGDPQKPCTHRHRPKQSSK